MMKVSLPPRARWGRTWSLSLSLSPTPSRTLFSFAPPLPNVDVHAAPARHTLWPMAPRAPPFSRSIARLFHVSSVACFASGLLVSLGFVVERIHRSLRSPVTDRVLSDVTTLFRTFYGDI